MYQIEVKYRLIKEKFNPEDGWSVEVAIDSMELGKGRFNSDDKRKTAQIYYEKIEKMGCLIKENDHYLDIVATHKNGQKIIIEVEGDSSKQRSTSLYSALGQVLIKSENKNDILALAFPLNDNWAKQIQKIPNLTKKRNNLKIYLVNDNSVVEL